MSNGSAVPKNAKVEIYSTAFCPYCIRAKSLLDHKGIEYLEYNIDQEVGLRHEMEQRSHRTSVPQIFIAEQHIGGCDEMYALEMNNELDDLLGLQSN